jgi:hypothetical protein
MRIFVCIANYGLDQIEYLFEIIKAYEAMPFDVRIHIATTTPLAIYGFRHGTVISWNQYKEEIGEKLVFDHRNCMARVHEQSPADLYIYQENDILITEQNIRMLLDYTALLEPDEITGFLRYESKPDDDERYLIDMLEKDQKETVDFEKHQISVPAIHRMGQVWFTIGNLHQGCFVITPAQLTRAISSKGFLVDPHREPWGMLEQGASDIYTQCGFQHKMLPYDGMEHMLVHHMPNKFMKMKNNFGAVTVKQLKELLSV